MNRRPGYSKEVRERAVRPVLTREHDHSARSVALQKRLRSWIKKIEVDPDTDSGVNISQAQRANEILRKAAAFFAAPLSDATHHLPSKARSSTAKSSDGGLHRSISRTLQCRAHL